MSGSSSVVGVDGAAGGGGGVRAVGGVVGGGGGGGGGSGGPCGACKFLRRKCVSGCIFAPYFDSEQGAAHFAAVHKVFGASNVSKLLMHLPSHRRLDAVVTISYEAQARLRDPVYGCVAHIFALQQQVVNLQAEVSYLRAHLATLELPSPPPPPSPPHFSISDLPSPPPGPPPSFDLSALFDAPLHPPAAWSSLQQQQQKQRVDPRPTGAGRGGSPTETTRGTGDLQAALARQLDGHRPAASVETPPSIPKVTK